MNFINNVIGRDKCLLLQLKICFSQKSVFLTDFFIYKDVKNKSDNYQNKPRKKCYVILNFCKKWNYEEQLPNNQHKNSTIFKKRFHVLVGESKLQPFYNFGISWLLSIH